MEHFTLTLTSPRSEYIKKKQPRHKIMSRNRFFWCLCVIEGSRMVSFAICHWVNFKKLACGAAHPAIIRPSVMKNRLVANRWSL